MDGRTMTVDIRSIWKRSIVAGKPVTDMRLVRNGLAHGNIIYLNQHGWEVPS
jgi:hypothetical protein